MFHWMKWVSFSLITLSSLFFVLVALPSDILPDSLSDHFNDYKLRLGIDLEGGTQLEYEIDFSPAQKRIDLSRADTESDNDLPDLNPIEVAQGVAETLKRRIDPDGTREINVFVLDLGEKKHVVVELPSNIDTPEVRELLEKSIDLQFKEPMDSEDRMAIAQGFLDQLLSEETSFEKMKELYQEDDTMIYEENDYTLETLNSLFSNNGSNLWNFSSGEIFPSLLTKQSFVFDGTGFSQVSYPLIVRVGEKKIQDRVISQPEKTFTQIQEELSQEGDINLEVSDIDFSFVSSVVNLEVGAISEVLENEEAYFIYESRGIGEDGVAQQYAQIFILKSEENSEQKIQDIYSSLQEKEQTIAEEVLSVEGFSIQSQWKDTILGGSQFNSASVSVDQMGMPVTAIIFNKAGGQIFEDITLDLSQREGGRCKDSQRGTGEQFAIFVGGEIVSAPCVYEKISGGSAIITSGAGNYQDALKNATTLAYDLNTGATPAPIFAVSERKISSELGTSSFTESLIAAAIGFFALAIWMIVFYRFFGFLAILALAFYTLSIIFLLKYFSFIVLTLAGIAGIILSVGMAVDANILIFERIREELQGGKDFESAVKIGFDRAWTSIRDSNISSLLTCMILFAFGSSIIKGFAVTLALGILISMFTAIMVTKNLIITLTPQFLLTRLSLLLGK